MDHRYRTILRHQVSTIRINVYHEEWRIPPQFVFCKIDSVACIQHNKNKRLIESINAEINVLIRPLEIEIPYYNNNILYGRKLTTGDRLGEIWDRNSDRANPFQYYDINPPENLWKLYGELNGNGFTLPLISFAPVT